MWLRYMEGNNKGTTIIRIMFSDLTRCFKRPSGGTRVRALLLTSKRKWRGYTLRKLHDDIIRTLLYWNSQGSRRRRRPSKTWKRKVADEVMDKVTARMKSKL